jgi:hypothetical protein
MAETELTEKGGLAKHGLVEVGDLANAVDHTHEEARSQQRLLRSFVRATGLPIRI